MAVTVLVSVSIALCLLWVVKIAYSVWWKPFEKFFKRMSNHSCTMIEENGVFNASDLEKFMKDSELESCGTDYVVVSIVGPQNSGKSTLLNRLFNTNFKEMNIKEPRGKTTKGLCISHWVGIHHPNTIVMDIEGSDGQERGQNTAFEKKITVFALAMSHILLINMLEKAIGLVNGASWPLLELVFEVMMQLSTIPRKRTLLFVFRDTDPESPLEVLRSQIEETIEKTWDALPKPGEYRNTCYSDLLKVEVTFLSNYKYAKSKFDKEVAELRNRFINSTALGGLASHREDLISASLFSARAEMMWKTIGEMKKLDLPFLNVMVDTHLCEEAKEATLRQLREHQEWQSILQRAKHSRVPGFGKSLSNLIEIHLRMYDEATKHVDEKQRKKMREQLLSMALEIVRPVYKDMLIRISREALTHFKDKFHDIRKSKTKLDSSASDFKQDALEEFDSGCTDASIEQSKWSDHIESRTLLAQDISDEISSAQERIRRKEGTLRAVTGAVMVAAGTVTALAGGAVSGVTANPAFLGPAWGMSTALVAAGCDEMSEGLKQRKIGESSTSSQDASIEQSKWSDHIESRTLLAQDISDEISSAQERILRKKGTLRTVPGAGMVAAGTVTALAGGAVSGVTANPAFLGPAWGMSTALVAAGCDEMSEGLKQRKIGESSTSSQDARIIQANWSDHIEPRTLLAEDISYEIRLAEVVDQLNVEDADMLLPVIENVDE